MIHRLRQSVSGLLEFARDAWLVIAFWAFVLFALTDGTIIPWLLWHAGW